MIKAVIIDDEARARNLLKGLVEKQFPDRIKVIGDADDIQSGIKMITELKPDLVFLDIQMHEGTGFDLLKQLPEVNFEVIFVTAYDQFAVEAFKFSAFGYLLKPIRTTELNETIERLEKHLKQLREETDKRFRVLIENYGDDRKIKKLVITGVDGFKVLPMEDIIRLEGDRNYTNFILTEKSRVTTSKSLGEYEEMLNDHGFFRVHQSTIINLRHVKGYFKGDGGKVEMTDGEEVQVSRHRKQGLLDRFF